MSDPTMHLKINTLFEYFARVNLEKDSTRLSTGEMRVECRSAFFMALLLEILPRKMSMEELTIVYRDVTNGKLTVSADLTQVPMALGLIEFKEFLFRIAFKKKKFYDTVGPETLKDSELVERPIKLEYLDIFYDDFYGKEERKKIEKFVDIYPDRAQSNKSEYTVQCWEGFISSLRLPSTKELIIKRLDFLRRYFRKEVIPQDEKYQEKKETYERMKKRNEILRLKRQEEAQRISAEVDQKRAEEEKLENAKKKALKEKMKQQRVKSQESRRARPNLYDSLSPGKRLGSAVKEKTEKPGILLNDKSNGKIIVSKKELRTDSQDSNEGKWNSNGKKKSVKFEEDDEIVEKDRKKGKKKSEGKSKKLENDDDDDDGGSAPKKGKNEKGGDNGNKKQGENDIDDSNDKKGRSSNKKTSEGKSKKQKDEEDPEKPKKKSKK